MEEDWPFETSWRDIKREENRSYMNRRLNDNFIVKESFEYKTKYVINKWKISQCIIYKYIKKYINKLQKMGWPNIRSPPVTCVMKQLLLTLYVDCYCK